LANIYEKFHQPFAFNPFVQRHAGRIGGIHLPPVV
jgi:hypothetical protein